MDNRFREGLILFPDVSNLDPAPQVFDITSGRPPNTVLNTDPIHKAINMLNGLSGPPAIWPHHPHEHAHGSRRRRDRCRGGQKFTLNGTGLGRHHYNRAGDNAAGSKLDAPEGRLVPKPSPTPKAPAPNPAASALSGELISSTPWSIIVVEHHRRVDRGGLWPVVVVAQAASLSVGQVATMLRSATTLQPGRCLSLALCGWGLCRSGVSRFGGAGG